MSFQVSLSTILLMFQIIGLGLKDVASALETGEAAYERPRTSSDNDIKTAV
jgi:hypothetical protein